MADYKAVNARSADVIRKIFTNRVTNSPSWITINYTGDTPSTKARPFTGLNRFTSSTYGFGIVRADSLASFQVGTYGHNSASIGNIDDVVSWFSLSD